MAAFAAFYASMVGKKVVMESRVSSIGFVIIHPSAIARFPWGAAINSYSHFLQAPASCCGAVRIVPHRCSRSPCDRRRPADAPEPLGRPIAYHETRTPGRDGGIPPMRWGGAFLFVFIVLHILHFRPARIRPAGVFSAEDV